ncbi:hypothetical protein COU78_06765 [Candidatus Peregrinibacteria bacterium CG10_big_fil_rev_8_21_14_0_10_49_24]|nr:MAG: hypothetical protein COV83_02060 [Candidatus Peregrinibacteria bacterium CG11_big_fil_rev_8_21_14_0_20_49_14]PIR50391.1 MAG: hypothetical protein COU78_06765 [Candidatus Peregrinibacteria bacterium CG10_big_fil_rev_8_21_14_0_10_49_24]PJA67480.1 MAG: hypothetical protein CO157_03555 [Candidatus Peregrinibacteria bacterium CG_4_9_14_3_um_filter_49_12]
MLLAQQKEDSRQELPSELMEAPKKNWSKWGIVLGCVAGLAGLNLVLASWINTETQFAVGGDSGKISTFLTPVRTLLQKVQREHLILPDEPQSQQFSEIALNSDTESPKTDTSMSIGDIIQEVQDGAEDLSGIKMKSAAMPQEESTLMTITRVIQGLSNKDKVIESVSTKIQGSSVIIAAKQTAKRYGEFIVANEIAGKLYDQVGVPVLSQQGDMAYLAKDGAIMKVVLNGVEMAEYKDFGPSVLLRGSPLEGTRTLEEKIPQNYLRNVTEDALQFTKSGKLVFTAWKSKKPLVVIDGEEGKQYDVIQKPVISPDGERVSYVVGQASDTTIEVTTPGGCNTAECIEIFRNMAGRTPGNRKYTYYVITDGSQSTPYDEVRELTFSGNGKNIGFLGRRASQWFAVINGVEGSAYEESKALQFSEDGTEYVYAARKGSNWQLVRGGLQSEITPIPSAVGSVLLFRFQSNTYGYADPSGRFTIGNTQGISKPIPGFFLQVGPDNTTVALLRQAGGSRARVVLYDTETGKETLHNPYENIVQSLISLTGKTNLIFSEDAKHSAYPLLIIDGESSMQTMVVDGTRQAAYSTVSSPVFAPSGVSVAYTAIKLDAESGSKKALAVVNGHEGPLYDEIIGEIQFNENETKVRYLTKNDGELLWVEQKVLPKE